VVDRLSVKTIPHTTEVKSACHQNHMKIIDATIYNNNDNNNNNTKFI